MDIKTLTMEQLLKRWPHLSKENVCELANQANFGMYIKPLRKRASYHDLEDFLSHLTESKHISDNERANYLHFKEKFENFIYDYPFLLEEKEGFERLATVVEGEIFPSCKDTSISKLIRSGAVEFYAWTNYFGFVLSKGRHLSNSYRLLVETNMVHPFPPEGYKGYFDCSDVFFFIDQIERFEIKDKATHFGIDLSLAESGISNFKTCDLEEAAKILDCNQDNVIDICVSECGSFGAYLKKGQFVIKSISYPYDILEIEKEIKAGKVDLEYKYPYTGLLRIKKEPKAGESIYGKFTLSYLRSNGIITVKSFSSASCPDPLDDNFSLALLPLQPALSEIIHGVLKRAQLPRDIQEIQITRDDLVFVKEELQEYINKNKKDEKDKKNLQTINISSLNLQKNEVELEKKFVFKKDEKNFHIQFGEEKARFKILKGLEYINHLLKNKEKTFFSYNLYHAVCKTDSKVLENFDETDDEDELEGGCEVENRNEITTIGMPNSRLRTSNHDVKKSKETMRKAIEKLEDDILQAKESSDISQEQELASRLVALKKLESKEYNRRGKPRSNSSQEKARLAVGAAIKYALDQIKKEGMEGLHAHLTDNLWPMANQLHYKGDLDWDT